MDDKNIGPYVMNIEDYVSQFIKQHLSDENTYERISKEVASELMEETVNEFLDYIRKVGLQLHKDKHKCLNTALNQFDGIANFYCMPKVHKNKIPVPLRPVVATINTPMCAIG